MHRSLGAGIDGCPDGDGLNGLHKQNEAARNNKA